MATMMTLPPAPAPIPPSSAPPHNLLPRHHTNHNPNPISNHHHHQLYLGNIPWDATEEEIIEECSIFGRVVSLSLMRDKETGKHKGFGFIEFADEESALCAKRNQKGLLCHGRQLKVCDPINNKKKQQQQQQPRQNSNSFPVKRPHEEAADGEPQASAHKRLHIDVQLTHTNEDDGKSQSAAHNVLHSGCLPSHSNSNSVAINNKKKRSNEASSADDDDSQQSSSAIKRPCIIHLQLPRSSAKLHEPYSPTSPGFVWPQNTRNIHQEGSHSQVDDNSSQQQMKKPTIIDHIDFSSALSSAKVGVGGDLLVTDKGFIKDLLNLSSLLRSACIEHDLINHQSLVRQEDRSLQKLPAHSF